MCSHFDMTTPFRSKKWVEKCQRKDLIDKSPDQLHRYYRLCGKHFETSLIDCVSYVFKLHIILGQIAGDTVTEDITVLVL